MSIDRETFESASEQDLTELSPADRALGFLAVNGDSAFTTSEIGRRTELDAETARTALSQLADRGIVENKGPYWAITGDDQRLVQYDDYARATALFNDEFGEEDREAWATHAPDEPHPSLSEDDA
jgi:predicted transcriptional regulator of viral defense system